MKRPGHTQKAVALFAALLLMGALLACFGCAHDTSSSSALKSEETFSQVVEDTVAPPDPITISFIALGDIVPHKEVIRHSFDQATGTYDFNPVFAPMLARLAPFDLAAVTQETPLVSDEGQVGGYPVFGTPAEMADAIVNAGFDIVTSATNHSLDQGAEGVLETIAYWKSHYPQITVLGIHDNPAEANGVTFVDCKGIRIAFTDCTYGLNGFELPEGLEYEVDLLDDLDIIAANVAAAQDEADLTICYVHMGEEYATVPSDEQRFVAEVLIDAGADVVLGSHVHVVQPMETITTDAGNTGIVYFSLGNCANNQADVENMLGGAAVLQITKSFDEGGASSTSVTAHEFVPTFCYYDYGSTEMYFLEDVTQEMADNHFITLYGHPFTVDEVYEIWTAITGIPRA